MNRRGFLGAILAAAAAPAIVRAESLMRIAMPTTAEVIAVQSVPPWVMSSDMLELLNARIIAAANLIADRIEADVYRGSVLVPSRYDLENFL